MENNNLFHLAFPVHDLVAAREFYGGVLECEEARSSERWVDFNLFGHQIVAHLAPESAGAKASNSVDADSVPVPHFGIILSMDKWRELADKLTAKGIKFIIEPDHFFAFNSNKPDPAENEAFAFRSMPFEFGLLVWVTDITPQSPLDWPEKAHSIPPENTTLLMDAYLIKEKPASGTPEMTLNKDVVHAGESVTYYIHPIASDTGKGDIPLAVLVFWDEILVQADNLLIPVQAAIKQEYIPYKIQVPSNLTEGTHYLTVVGYPYPYYLRGWGDGSEWRIDVGPFSNLMARIPVQVEK